MRDDPDILFQCCRKSYIDFFDSHIVKNNSTHKNKNGNHIPAINGFRDCKLANAVADWLSNQVIQAFLIGLIAFLKCSPEGAFFADY
jgi:hypothetical protein